MPKLTIGRVAAAAGVNVETIRYYQRRGLLEEPTKPLGGYRNYPTEMVKRIRFIKKAQALGFTLENVAGLLHLNDTDACAKTRDLAARKLALIEQKISELANMRDALSKLVGQCDRKVKRGACPIIEILQWESGVDPSDGLPRCRNLCGGIEDELRTNRASRHRMHSRLSVEPRNTDDLGIRSHQKNLPVFQRARAFADPAPVKHRQKECVSELDFPH